MCEWSNCSLVVFHVREVVIDCLADVFWNGNVIGLGWLRSGLDGGSYVGSRSGETSLQIVTCLSYPIVQHKNCILAFPEKAFSLLLWLPLLRSYFIHVSVFLIDVCLYLSNLLLYIFQSIQLKGFILLNLSIDSPSLIKFPFSSLESCLRNILILQQSYMLSL